MSCHDNLMVQADFKAINVVCQNCFREFGIESFAVLVNKSILHTKTGTFKDKWFFWKSWVHNDQMAAPQ